jgi:hypothetical protein
MIKPKMSTPIMNIDVRTEESNPSHATSSPPPAGLALVRCARVICLAFRDANGKWIRYFDRKELADTVEVLPSAGPWNQS